MGGNALDAGREEREAAHEIAQSLIGDKMDNAR